MRCSVLVREYYRKPPADSVLPSVASIVGRKVDLDDLVGTVEIAERLGVKRPGVIHDWRRRYEDFPQPVTTLSNVLVWLWPDVAAWARRTGRLDRPTKR